MQKLARPVLFFSTVSCLLLSAAAAQGPVLVDPRETATDDAANEPRKATLEEPKYSNDDRVSVHEEQTTESRLAPLAPSGAQTPGPLRSVVKPAEEVLREELPAPQPTIREQGPAAARDIARESRPNEIARDEILRERRRAAWIQLGIALDDREQDRAVVRNVYPDSPAERIGLQPGDIIVSVNDEEVLSRDDLLNQLQQHVDRYGSVRNLDLRVSRTVDQQLGRESAVARPLRDSAVNRAGYAADTQLERRVPELEHPDLFSPPEDDAVRGPRTIIVERRPVEPPRGFRRFERNPNRPGLLERFRRR